MKSSTDVSWQTLCGWISVFCVSVCMQVCVCWQTLRPVTVSNEDAGTLPTHPQVPISLILCLTHPLSVSHTYIQTSMQTHKQLRNSSFTVVKIGHRTPQRYRFSQKAKSVSAKKNYFAIRYMIECTIHVCNMSPVDFLVYHQQADLLPILSIKVRGFPAFATL